MQSGSAPLQHLMFFEVRMEDYESSAVRHLANAELLKERGELDNAGHLVGFAAECAIKFRIATLRPMQGAPHGHLPELLYAARKHTTQRGSYDSMHGLVKADIFRTWNVNRRYSSTGSTTEAELNEWITCTKRLFAAARIVKK